MHIKNLTRLSVIEMPYGDLNWGPDPKHIREGIYSDIQLWDKSVSYTHLIRIFWN